MVRQAVAAGMVGRTAWPAVGSGVRAARTAASARKRSAILSRTAIWCPLRSIRSRSTSTGACAAKIRGSTASCLIGASCTAYWLSLGHYQWTPQDNAVYELIANACTQVLAHYNGKTTVAAHAATKEWLFLSLLENGTLDRGSFRLLEESLRLTGENRFRLAKLMLAVPTSPQLLGFTVRRLHGAFPQLLCVLNRPEEANAGIYILLRYTRDEDVTTQLNQLEHFSEAYTQCQLDVSKPFTDLTEVPSARVQVDFLSKYFSRPYKKGIHHYEYHALDHIFQVVTDSIPADCYTPAAIRRLEKYDRENHTDYLNTLSVYLRSFLNSKKTVEYFGFHRNTLLHRLGQIQTITDIELDDEQELLNLLLALELRQSAERR